MKKSLIKLFLSSAIIPLMVIGLMAGSANAAASYTNSNVSKHNKASDCWVIANNRVFNVTKLLNKEQGLKNQCGKDVTSQYLNNMGALTPYAIGNLNSSKSNINKSVNQGGKSNIPSENGTGKSTMPSDKGTGASAIKPVQYNAETAAIAMPENASDQSQSKNMADQNSAQQPTDQMTVQTQNFPQSAPLNEITSNNQNGQTTQSGNQSQPNPQFQNPNAGQQSGPQQNSSSQQHGNEGNGVNLYGQNGQGYPAGPGGQYGAPNPQNPSAQYMNEGQGYGEAYGSIPGEGYGSVPPYGAGGRSYMQNPEFYQGGQMPMAPTGFMGGNIPCDCPVPNPEKINKILQDEFSFGCGGIESPSQVY